MTSTALPPRARLLDQMELQLGELVERRAQETMADEIAEAPAASKEGFANSPVTSSEPPRQKPARRPLPRASVASSPR